MNHIFQVMAALDPKSISLFHFAGKKHTTPNCPVSLQADYNPSSAAQAYKPSDDVCSKAAVYSIPFFQKRPGPKYEEWTVCAHETRPGHHLQVSMRNPAYNWTESRAVGIQG